MSIMVSPRFVFPNQPNNSLMNIRGPSSGPYFTFPFSSLWKTPHQCHKISSYSKITCRYICSPHGQNYFTKRSLKTTTIRRETPSTHKHTHQQPLGETCFVLSIYLSNRNLNVFGWIFIRENWLFNPELSKISQKNVEF